MADPGRPRAPGCSELSRAAGEPLHATAAHATEWLLLEAPGPWAREVGGGEGGSRQARAALLAWRNSARARGPRRILLVRRPGRRADTPVVFLVAADDDRRAVRRLVLSEYDELAEHDLETAGDPIAASLVLVCAHGSRDRCCGARGAATFDALRTSLGEDELWLSSHHGGHRFAANVLVLPAGVHLGRIDPDCARDVVAQALAGEIDLDHYRGRTCYPPAVQAAEQAVREAKRITRLDDVRLVGLDPEAGSVRFRDAGGREQDAVVEETTGPVVPPSCGTAPELQRRFVARVLG